MTALVGTGVVADDFTQIISDSGVTVSYKVVTKTIEGMSGSETTSFATASNKTVIFFKIANKYLWDKEGILMVADSYIIAPTSLGIKRYDQFQSPEGEWFYIENVSRRYMVGVTLMDYAECFLVQ
jgi:hypothetical protein